LRQQIRGANQLSRIKLRFKAITVLALAATLSGCGATPNLSDDLTSASLSTANQGIVLLSAAMEGRTCQSITVQLGKKSALAYETTTSFGIDITVFSLRRLVSSNLPQISLPAGEHHVIGVTCQNGNSFTSIGKGSLRSYASFTLAPGEILNLGSLTVIPVGLTNMATFQVRDQTVEVIDKVRADKPKLFAQMKTRLMIITPAPTAEDRQKQLDAFQALLASTPAMPAAKSSTDAMSKPVR
jgi:hypothetical protein